MPDVPRRGLTFFWRPLAALLIGSGLLYVAIELLPSFESGDTRVALLIGIAVVFVSTLAAVGLFSVDAFRMYRRWRSCAVVPGVIMTGAAGAGIPWWLQLVAGIGGWATLGALNVFLHQWLERKLGSRNLAEVAFLYDGQLLTSLIPMGRQWSRLLDGTVIWLCLDGPHVHTLRQVAPANWRSAMPPPQVLDWCRDSMVAGAFQDS